MERARLAQCLHRCFPFTRSTQRWRCHLSVNTNKWTRSYRHFSHCDVEYSKWHLWAAVSISLFVLYAPHQPSQGKIWTVPRLFHHQYWCWCIILLTLLWSDRQGPRLSFWCWVQLLRRQCCLWYDDFNICINESYLCLCLRPGLICLHITQRSPGSLFEGVL